MTRTRRGTVSLALHRAYYNICRPHQTPSKEAGATTTPAMAVGLEDHSLTLVVDRVFPFESTKEALACVDKGRAKGKVVVKVI